VTKSWSFGEMPSTSQNASGNKPNATTSPSANGSHAPEAKRYTMQFSVNFLNLFNNVNLGTPVGSLSSPFFGQSLNVTQYGGFGPSGSSGAGNRRIFANVRISF